MHTSCSWRRLCKAACRPAAPHSRPVLQPMRKALLLKSRLSHNLSPSTRRSASLSLSHCNDVEAGNRPAESSCDSFKRWHAEFFIGALQANELHAARVCAIDAEQARRLGKQEQETVFQQLHDWDFAKRLDAEPESTWARHGNTLEQVPVPAQQFVAATLTVAGLLNPQGTRAAYAARLSTETGAWTLIKSISAKLQSDLHLTDDQSKAQGATGVVWTPLTGQRGLSRMSMKRLCLSRPGHLGAQQLPACSALRPERSKSAGPGPRAAGCWSIQG